MKKQKFKKDFESHLSNLISQIECNIEENKNINFEETANEIFNFLSKAHFGRLTEEENMKLFLDNSDVIAIQFYKLISLFKNK
jgi:hypothetical protein